MLSKDEMNMSKVGKPDLSGLNDLDEYIKKHWLIKFKKYFVAMPDILNSDQYIYIKAFTEEEALELFWNEFIDDVVTLVSIEKMNW